MTRAARRSLLGGAALIAVAWAVAPTWSPPLYDGLIGPAEAYRYLNPPPGYQSTPPPSSATKQLSVSGGTVPASFLTTNEQPPQAQFLVGDSTLVPPSGATTINVDVKPIPPPAPLPAALGHIEGNVYAVTATADNGAAVTIKSGVTPPTVVLRGPPGTSAAQIARLVPGGTWTKLHTVPLGNNVPDMVATNTDTLGDFVMVLNTADSGGNGNAGPGSGGSFPVVAVIVPLVVVLMLAGLLAALRGGRPRPRRR